MTKPHNIYIHVPFCASKCNYCAFYSYCPPMPDWNEYLAGVLSEIDHWHKRMGKISVPTIFFGGGTPSLMPTDVFARIMNSIRDRFDILPNAEITMESNPGTLDAKRLGEFKNGGINRLSVGIQSLNDRDLKFLGRKHTAIMATKLIQTATDMGLRVSGDFIYGLPGQTVNDVKNLCNQINALPLTHCSMYELSIEPNTPFGKMNLIMPDNDTMAAMYEMIADTLNLKRYEVSNYGDPCLHNQNIWDGDPYIGIGTAAAGRPLIDDNWYDQCGGDIICEPIDTRTRAVEKIITGLRTTRGVQLTPDVHGIIDWDFVHKNPVFEIQDNHLMIKNFLILDNLMLQLVA